MNNIFEGSNPIEISKRWLAEAEKTELNDPNAMALASVDPHGMPNVRMVLLKEIESTGFVFYTNFKSAKAKEILSSGKAALVIHWKSLRRQIRVRGGVIKISDEQADRYFNSRSLNSRYGAIASEQSKPLQNRAYLEERVARVKRESGDQPKRPEYWGGFKITPIEMELWADGEDRLHNRFKYSYEANDKDWTIQRLFP
ncbi:MAG: pyridoxamine 5'-phosphate oxidase [Rhodobacteraceae bacterium]|nr:pyridoxamine 5'-phosphate oxidase [Paracoccaceae bacterium]